MSEVKNRPWSDSRAAAENPEAGRLLDELFAVLDLLRSHVERRVVEFDLNAIETFALRVLVDPLPMGRLAEVLGCDPSHVTGVADSLEARGALRREVHPNDRRVKLLTLTSEGRALRDQVETRLFDDLPVIRGLSKNEQRTLVDLLGKIVAANTTAVQPAVADTSASDTAATDTATAAAEREPARGEIAVPTGSSAPA